MRTTEREIAWTSAFKRDYKRIKKTDSGIASLLAPVLSALALDQPLEERHRDHALTGDKKPFRDCHVRPDLILLYHKPDDDTLVLVRLGSHAELSL